jgi:hypothetical protein
MKCVGLQHMGSSSSKLPAYYFGVDTCSGQFAVPGNRAYAPLQIGLAARNKIFSHDKKGTIKGGPGTYLSSQEQEEAPLCSSTWHERADDVVIAKKTSIPALQPSFLLPSLSQWQPIRLRERNSPDRRALVPERHPLPILHAATALSKRIAPYV